MANVFQINAYQINQRPIPLSEVTAVGLPVTGVVLQDCINSPTRSLSTGVSVYSSATTLADGKIYYCQLTIGQLVTLVNT